MLQRLKTLIKIPPRLAGPVKVLQVIFKDVRNADVFKHASAMAYVTLFSLVPSIAAIFSLVSVFSQFYDGSSEIMSKLKNIVLENLAQGSGEQAIQYFDGFIANLDIAKIGITGFAGIMVTLILLLRNIELALNQIFHVTKERNFFSRFVNFWTFVTLGTFIAVVSIGILSGFNLSNLNPFEDTVVQRGFTEWLTPKLAVWVFFALLYKVTPNTFIPFKHAAIGAVVSAILFTLASSFYGTFTSKFTNHQAVYGALAAVPLFLMWLYLVWIITLLGGVVTSRAMVGFDIGQTESDLKFNPHDPLEKHRDHQLQDAVPFVLLVLIYKQFAQAGGEGLKLSTLREGSHLPETWLIEAMDFLEHAGYVIKGVRFGKELAENSSQYFPAFPADSLRLKDLMEKLREESGNWLGHWNQQIGLEHQQIVDAYWKQKFEKGEDATIKDLILASTKT